MIVVGCRQALTIDTRGEPNKVWVGPRQILTWRFFKVPERGAESIPV